MSGWLQWHTLRQERTLLVSEKVAPNTDNTSPGLQIGVRVNVLMNLARAIAVSFTMLNTHIANRSEHAPEPRSPSLFTSSTIPIKLTSSFDG